MLSGAILVPFFWHSYEIKKDWGLWNFVNEDNFFGLIWDFKRNFEARAKKSLSYKKNECILKVKIKRYPNQFLTQINVICIQIKNDHARCCKDHKNIVSQFPNIKENSVP